MKKELNWECSIAGKNDFFYARVPGNAQEDYAAAHNWGDVNFADNCEMYRGLEDYGWIYRAEFATQEDGTWFVSEGIDYECDIFLNGSHLLHNVGLYKKIEIDLTKFLKAENVIEVHIAPVPKDGRSGTRDEAAQVTKPAVSYGWDWHPRLVPTGMWQKAYLETRGESFIFDVDVTYTLDDALENAQVCFDITGGKMPEIRLYSPDGKLLYEGNETEIEVNDVELWWCSGQGKPTLYTYEVTAGENIICGTIGFKKIELVMNDEAWDEPSDFPKGRSVPPITVCLNNRRIFAKGSNWVAPEIFYGKIKHKRYDELLTLVRDANMNILRCWGGAVVGKEDFFDLCDQYGIMVWQEFPLACNLYRDTKFYLDILEDEAVSIIKRVKKHACHCIWCGGNELFNRWSGMTDQSLALRLLNKLCYELDRDKPFLPTAPVMGMGHGHYLFYDADIDKTVHEIYGNSRCTAYSEFGVPSLCSMENLRKIIPPELIDEPAPDTPWQTHHAFGAWDAAGIDTWICRSVMEKYFGVGLTVEEMIKYSQFLQSEGLKFIFEEARRQQPYCSMAMNWCFAEPWITAANSSIISYPAEPKPAYYAVKAALRSVMPSLKMQHFLYTQGELFSGELWFLNDSGKAADTKINVFLMYDDKKELIITWDTGVAAANKRGHIIQFVVPESDNKCMKIRLESSAGNSEYSFLTVPPAEKEDFSIMNG
ncbi:MAG: hypothetical protein J6C82_06995 [Clostridia bacterium]|nr:hypothetical protein [Clostridia bacterium]